MSASPRRAPVLLILLSMLLPGCVGGGDEPDDTTPTGPETRDEDIQLNVTFDPPSVVEGGQSLLNVTLSRIIPANAPEEFVVDVALSQGLQLDSPNDWRGTFRNFPISRTYQVLGMSPGCWSAYVNVTFDEGDSILRDQRTLAVEGSGANNETLRPACPPS